MAGMFHFGDVASGGHPKQKVECLTRLSIGGPKRADALFYRLKNDEAIQTQGPVFEVINICSNAILNIFLAWADMPPASS